MSYSYDAGSTTPFLAGLVEFGGIRINDGTFKLTDLGGLLNSAPVRNAPSSLPNDHGGWQGPVYQDPLPFTLAGYIDVDLVDYIDPALDDLQAAFDVEQNPDAQLLVVNRTGWSARRQVTAIIAGALTVEEPVDLEKKVPQRNFTVPMIAVDPRKYNADTLQTVDIPVDGSSHAVTNGGNRPAPFIVQFFGPFTTSITLTSDSTGDVLEYDSSAVDGAYIEVQTNPVVGRTAVTNAGVDEYVHVGTFSLTGIPPGTSNFHCTVASGSGVDTKARLIFRDTWA